VSLPYSIAYPPCRCPRCKGAEEEQAQTQTHSQEQARKAERAVPRPESEPPAITG
jgi:phage FluMu protein Com